MRRGPGGPGDGSECEGGVRRAGPGGREAVQLHLQPAQLLIAYPVPVSQLAQP
jgi:hypothetical protein